MFVILSRMKKVQHSLRTLSCRNFRDFSSSVRKSYAGCSTTVVASNDLGNSMTVTKHLENRTFIKSKVYH